VKIRTRRFSGRCARHMGYNPVVDGRGGIRGNCARCNLLADIWEASMKLDHLIRRFEPYLDDVPVPPERCAGNDRQLSLLDAFAPVLGPAGPAWD
jgi:hypothetical protein